MSSEERSAGVAEAHPALVEMLQSLLAEVPEASPEPPPVQPPPAPPAAAAEPVLNETTVLPLQRERECVLHGTDARTLNTPESRFAAIVFGVGRYRFAAPLNTLDSVARVDSRPTAIFGQPDWHRGVVVNRGQQLVLVDPGRLLGLDDAEPVDPPDHVLVLPGGRYGILSSVPPQPVTLHGSGIRWSRHDPRRPWLAAVLPEQMCVMVDVEEFIGLI